MRKYFFVAALLILCNIISRAQEVDFGVKTGININTVKYRQSAGEMASVGYYAGLMAQIPISDQLFIRPEVQYSLKGFRYPAVGAAGSGNVRFHYIAVPLLAGFPIGDKFAALIGPEIGFLTSAKSKFASGTIDVGNNYQKFDWGLDLGGQYKVTPELGVAVRYNYGFRTLIKGITTDENGNPTGSNRDGANRVFQAGLFYLL